MGEINIHVQMGFNALCQVQSSRTHIYSTLPIVVNYFVYDFCNVIIICRKRIRAPCGLRGCKNGPAPFPGRMSYKATKPGLVLYLSMFFIVLMFIRAPFYVLLVFIVCVVCLLVVLVKLSLLAKLLARKPL